MRVNIRIVGIFYTNTVTIRGNKNTIKNVLDASVQDPGRNIIFNYGINIFKEKESVTSFSAKYLSDFNSPTSQRPYPAGLYSISENLNDYPVYSVWQYYIFDKKNVCKNKGNGAIPFNQAPVSDGDSVVWRLINIHAPINQSANNTSPRLEQLYAL